MSLNRRQVLGATIASSLMPSILATQELNTIKKRQMPSYFACNMESWWTELPFLERFIAASEAGFTAIEFWDYTDQSRNVKEIAKLCRSLELQIVQFTGWQGPSLALMDNHDVFTESMKRAVEVAHELDAPMFTVVGHQSVNGVSHEDSIENIKQALMNVAPILEDAEKMLILEPFNPVDHQGHFLNGSKDALTICRTIDSPSIKINWDLYHMQLTEGNLIDELKSGMDQVGYIQIADVPGRNQPGTGELNYRFIFKEIKKMKYEGYIGLECWPKNKNQEQAIQDLLSLV
jgi:hydroxypyruvate isomerase